MIIYIWGTGKVADRYLSTDEISMDCLGGFIETDKAKDMYRGKKVFTPKEVAKQEYDYIFVLVYRYSEQIREIAANSGIETDKMVYIDTERWKNSEVLTKSSFPYHVPCFYNENEVRLKFPKLFEMIEEKRAYSYMSIVTFSNGMDLIDNNRVIFSPGYDSLLDSVDYFRFRSFEFVAKEIKSKNIKGDCAEVGVFKGVFAKYINKMFPEKTLYLFDTFEGFDEQEISREIEAGLADESCKEVFNDTSIEYVKSIMPYPQNCIFRKGYFPNTAKGLEERTYAFVSIDVDLEESIFACLDYFYPRMEKGGVIFIHDYNNRMYFGVKKAIERFEYKIGHSLYGVPIADQGGTLIVTKW